MNRLKDFLDKYDTVIFDMDGVITSEQNYWNAAALTVWEYIKGGRINRDTNNAVRDAKIVIPSDCMDNVGKIRDTVFCGDSIIGTLKEKGVNSNWDLGYVVTALYIIHDVQSFGELTTWVRQLSGNIMDEYDNIALELAKTLEIEDAGRQSELWKNMQMCFQEWFLGDELYTSVYGREPLLKGKRGLLHSEEPIVDKERLKTLLSLMKEQNKRICTGTGRPSYEILTPLKSWYILKYFAYDGLINYDHVLKAEADTGMNLTKPHPYMFLKALYGEDTSDRELLAGHYDKDALEGTLIVGDAGSDIFAAKAMGADFCAVLTGVNGENGRKFFEDLGAEYIFNSIEDFLEDDGDGNKT